MPRLARLATALFAAVALVGCDEEKAVESATPTAPRSAEVAPAAPASPNIAAIAGRHTASVCKSYKRQQVVAERRLKAERDDAPGHDEREAEAEALAAIIEDTCK
jgi:hypothetical protein